MISQFTVSLLSKRQTFSKEMTVSQTFLSNNKRIRMNLRTFNPLRSIYLFKQMMINLSNLILWLMTRLMKKK